MQDLAKNNAPGGVWQAMSFGNGAFIQQLIQNSPFYIMELHVGMTITHVNDTAVNPSDPTQPELSLINKLVSGTKFTVQHDSTTKTFIYKE